jgi:hypothetical protein
MFRTSKYLSVNLTALLAKNTINLNIKFNLKVLTVFSLVRISKF